MFSLHHRFACLLTLTLSLAVSADGDIVYFADFESGVPGEFSSGNATLAGIGPEAINQGLSQYLGRFSGDQTTTLTLSGLHEHTTLTLTFDLLLFDSWDGSVDQFGQDYFSLAGDVIFSSTFTNHQGSAAAPFQDYDSLGDLFLNAAGTATSAFGVTDATQVFFSLGPNGSSSSFVVPHSSSELTIIFGGPTSGGQNPADELWGIDNVRIEIDVVPEASSTLLVTMFAVSAAGWTRRQAVRKLWSCGGKSAR